MLFIQFSDSLGGHGVHADSVDDALEGLRRDMGCDKYYLFRGGRIDEPIPTPMNGETHTYTVHMQDLDPWPEPGDWPGNTRIVAEGQVYVRFEEGTDEP